MSDTDYEVYLKRSQYDSLWEGDDLPMCGEDSEDIEKVIQQELATARRKVRRPRCR